MKKTINDNKLQKRKNKYCGKRENYCMFIGVINTMAKCSVSA